MTNILKMLYAQFRGKHEIQREITEIEGRIYHRKKLVLHDTLISMKRVLRRLGFTDKEDVVLTKGKVACIISACDEILITEIMFSGLFNDISPIHLASLISSLIFD